jgi:predicted ATPase/class 3 adenylate cyclase
MTDLPTGTVTFLFTDIEGSTRLWERYPEAMSEALARHDDILRTVIEANNGRIFKTAGDGVHAIFLAAPYALEAALEAQRALLREEWAETGPLRVRMALHTGTAEERDGDYFGPSMNRVARLLSAGHGGQVLLTSPTQELVRDQLPTGTWLSDLGKKRLKDLSRPEKIFQVMVSDLPSVFPALNTLEGYPNNLPLQATPLIGREREVEEVCERLRSPEVRLLTLTGAGGTGKTRMGLQVAADLLEKFEDGVFFVPLAAIYDPALVAPTIARTLGLTESGGQTLEELLKGYLRDRQSLLMLDNFEQVLDSAPLLEELLSTTPELKVLVTSRTPLRLYGEHVYPILPLSLPDPETLPPVEHLTEYGAVKLFVDRAKAVKPDFSLTEENARAVVEICARLDGLPLAIELAAARIKILPPRAMLTKLGSPLKLLTGGARNLPQRQRTLRSTIEWSYEMLDDGEKTLFAMLAVFSGGSTLEATEAVCDAGGTLPVDALEGVSSLLDKSLLRQEEGPEGEPRFAMLETIYEYARERLEARGDAEQLGRLHAEYFLVLAEEAETGLKGREQDRWLKLLEPEHNNMRAALSWTIDQEEAELGLRLAGALWRFWWVRGHFYEGRRWLEEMLAQGSGVPAAVRIKALDGLAWLADEQGDLDRAQAAAEEGLMLSAEAEIEDSSLTASLRGTLGDVVRLRGDDERARELFEESVRLYREAGDRWGVAWTLGGLGNYFNNQGDYGRAKEIYEEGLALSRQLGIAELHGGYLISLGHVSLVEGDYERAAALNEEAANLLRERGRKGGLVFALDNLGWAALLQGNHDRAEALHRESLALCEELGDRYIGSVSLEGLACSLASRGEAKRAATLFGAAEALREVVGYQIAPSEKALREPYLTVARGSTKEAVWDEAWREGQKMTFEEAVSYALEEAKNR